MIRSPSRRSGPGALAGLVGFPALGGISAAMVEQNLLIGAFAYYALLATAFCSPDAAPLRRAIFARRRGQVGPRPDPACAAETI